MKQFYIVATCVAALSANAQIINFPDANFKAKLLEPGVAYAQSFASITIDANGDGEIQVSEVQAVYGLNVSSANISDLTGIANFSSLKEFTCDYNQLTSLVIPAPISLSRLSAAHNALTVFNVQMDAINEGLNLSYNQLTTLTIPDASYFDQTDLSHNNLSSLSIGTAYFDYFSINGNNLASLQISGTATAYFTADFRDNQFSLLDLTHVNFNNEAYVYLGNNIQDRVVFGGQQPGTIEYSSNNTFLDLGNFDVTGSCEPEYQGNLFILNSPNLQYVILKNGFAHDVVTCNEGGNIFNIPALNLDVSNCPNLSFFCVDEAERASIAAGVASLGLQDQIEVNSYCTFTPGGTFYTITGATHFDHDGNGCAAGDNTVPFQQFNITNGAEYGSIAANSSGNYAIEVGAGTHSIAPVFEMPTYFTVSPASATADFPSDASPLTQNFCVSAIGVHPDLEISMVPLAETLPGMEDRFKIVCRNKGNQAQPCTATLVYDDAVLDLVSSNPAITSQATNSLTWDFGNLQPFERREILLILHINAPSDTPPVNAGDILHFDVSATGTLPDEMPDDNLFALDQTMINSLDPNEKTCLEGNAITPEKVGNYVHYVIRFENTGTANAQNIVVKDMIDPAKFDVSTLVPLSGSAPFTTRFADGGKVEFVFQNINLAFDDAGNDGYVAFKIKTKPNLVVGDTFSNSASIYFDYNFPVVTNTATTTIQLLGTPDFDFSDHFTVYPNPVKNVLNIFAKDGMEIKSSSVYNISGQLLMSFTGNGALEVSSLQPGNYFLKVYTDSGAAVSKFVKQ